MNNVREVNRINEKELELAVEGGASWHDDYKDSAYIFVGGLDKRLTEGDVISIFSQYGEILDINLPRIPEGGLRDRNGDNPPSESRNDREKQQQQQSGGKPGDRRGFGFLLYEDQRSTVLAVDNLNGFNLLGRTIRVDHVKDYKMPGAKRREEEGEKIEPSRNAAPAILNSSGSEKEEEEDAQDIDLADPMAAYIAAARKEKAGSKEEKEERRRRKEERRIRREEKARGKRMEANVRPGSETKRSCREGRSRYDYTPTRREEGRGRSPDDRRRVHRREDEEERYGHDARQYEGSRGQTSSRHLRDHHDRHRTSRNGDLERDREYDRRR